MTAPAVPVACTCGSPTTLGTVHRKDAPCFAYDGSPTVELIYDLNDSRNERDRLADRLARVEAALQKISCKATSAPGYLHTTDLADARGLLMEISDIAREAAQERQPS